jgi:hypothetical protein
MTLSGDPANRKQGRTGNRALGAFRQWSFKRLRQNSWNIAKLKGSEDTAELKDIDEPESLSSEFSESDVAYPEPPKGEDPLGELLLRRSNPGSGKHLSPSSQSLAPLLVD